MYSTIYTSTCYSIEIMSKCCMLKQKNIVFNRLWTSSLMFRSLQNNRIFNQSLQLLLQQVPSNHQMIIFKTRCETSSSPEGPQLSISSLQLSPWTFTSVERAPIITVPSSVRGCWYSSHFIDCAIQLIYGSFPQLLSFVIPLYSCVAVNVLLDVKRRVTKCIHN